MEHLVVRKMAPGSSQTFQAGELDDILRFGTAKMFAEADSADGAEQERIVWDDAAVDSLLDRTQAGDSGPGYMRQLSDRYETIER